MRGALRATWAVGATALALTVTSCGTEDGGGGGTADAAGIVRASWTDPQNPLEPANTNEVQGGKVLNMIFRGLKRYDPGTGRAEDLVAESVTTADQRNYTVRLRSGWTFSDGTPVTARSFTDAWNYGALVTNKQVSSYFFGYIEGYDQVHPDRAGAKPSATTMSGLKVVDDRTFTVALTQKFSTWPSTLGYAAYYPLPRSFFQDHDAWLRKPVGNGPYTVASYTRGQSMRLRRNDRYSGQDRAGNGGVDLKVYTDSSTAYTDLLAGNLDIADDIPAARIADAETDLGDRYINQPAGILQTLSFPMYDKRWGSKKAAKLRLGLSRAIDRERITDRIYSGTRTPATDWTSPVLGAAGGYREDMCGEACRYDPAAAKRLIAEAGGLPGGRVTISSNTDTGSHRAWLDAVCNSINNVLGDDRACAVEPMSTFAEFRDALSGDRMDGMFRAGWQMDYPLIQNFLQPLYYTGASSNDSGYSSAEFDRLVDAANAESDPAAAAARFQEAEKVLARDVPVVPLWYQNGTAGHSRRVRNVVLDQFSVPVFTDVEVTA